MPVIKCPNCGSIISSKATTCPKCGHPNNGAVGNDQPFFTPKQPNQGEYHPQQPYSGDYQPQPHPQPNHDNHVGVKTVKLNILRKRSFVGAAMRYRILINGTEIAKLTNGDSITYDVTVLPSETINLKVTMEGNALTIHGLHEEVELHPENCTTGVINCEIVTKGNTLGIITSGLLSPVGNVKINTEYL